MSPSIAKAGRPPKRLTLRLIRGVCARSVFELAREYYDQNLVDGIAVRQDGTLSGTVRGTRERHYWDVEGEIVLDYIGERSPTRHVAVSLDTGRWSCACPYSQVAVCSHVAALLVSAAKLKVMLPGGGLPARGKSGERTTLPYRREADQILDLATDPESADANLNDFLEMAVACYGEGDLAEALLVCTGTAESLLSGLDYPAYEGYFRLYPELPVGEALPSTRKPEGMDALRVDKFCEVVRKMLAMMSYHRILHEQKAPCIAALHRLYLRTNPWEPSRFCSLIITLLSKSDRDKEFLRELHDPIVPYGTPDPREDPVRFRAVMNLAERQARIYSDLKDYSLLASYAGRYRNDPGAWARYVMCLRSMGHDSTAAEQEGRRLFPDADAWGAPF